MQDKVLRVMNYTYNLVFFLEFFAGFLFFCLFKVFFQLFTLFGTFVWKVGLAGCPTNRAFELDCLTLKV